MSSMYQDHYTSLLPCQLLKRSPAGSEVQSPCITHTRLWSVALCSPRRGKVFYRTTAIHMWLQFQQLKIWHQWRQCIICHLIMTHHWKPLLIFPKVKNSSGICVIVFHLKSNPNVGCKREMRREMEREIRQRAEQYSFVREKKIGCIGVVYFSFTLLLLCQMLQNNLNQQLQFFFYSDIYLCLFLREGKLFKTTFFYVQCDVLIFILFQFAKILASFSHSFLQVSWVARTHLRVLRASKAATDWPSPGAASLHSAACSGYRRTTASTQKTTPPLCTATSPRALSKTMWGSALISARINPSSQQQHWQDTQVRCLEVIVNVRARKDSSF